ncbi:hypothetical protein GHT06_018193 [Daphnia sinensis]|uniref:Protein sprouty n=1 Tax=Daphnia sinensis TaxID=1820382 RepID=A0AAD5LDI0_9CRUS|nr:hypothetical protein GHT06_018193 [Daphnia sinensis]
MANHAKTIATQSSRTSSPSTHRNLVLISPEELDRPHNRSSQMELVPDRPSRIPALAPARPGVAVRVQSTRRVTSPLVVPRVAAPTLPLRQPVTTYTTNGSNTNNRSLLLASSSSSTSSSSSSNDAEVITLSQPRPDGERVRNEYIDTPLKGGLRSTPLHAETHIHISGSPHDHLALVSPLGSQSSSKTCSTKSLPFNQTANTPLTSPSLKRLQSTRRSLPITKQPAFTKDSSAAAANAACRLRDGGACPSASSPTTSRMVFSSPGSQSSSGGGSDSIICPDCDRCRCLSCRTPRPLPSKWLCGDKCLCSAESCVDYVTCLCCVKGIFYHCGSSSDDGADVDDLRRRSRYHPQSSSNASAAGNNGSCADAPCSCVPSHHRMARWGCLASLTLVMPCLLCYWPLQGGVKVVEMCYQKCTRHGCQCDQHQQRRRPTSASQATSSKNSAVVVQPLPTNSSGKRLLDI